MTLSTRPSYLALAVLLACGETPTPDDTDPGTGPGDGVPDVTPPSIVATTPASGAAGVSADQAITIAFSEPMDAESVESALDLTELGDVSMAWNLDNDTLTITPEAALEVVVAPGDSVAPPADYRVVVGADAADLAGNELGAEVIVDFTVVRELWLRLLPVDALTRTVTPSAVAFDVSDPLVVGDDDSDTGYRATLVFDLDLPGEPTTILAAELQTEQLTVETWGEPYDGLGLLTLDHVEFGDLETDNAINAAFNASQGALRTFGGVASAPTQTDIAVDVLEAVQADFAAGSTSSRFLLYFDGFTDLDGATDRAVFSRDDLRLEVRWLTT